MILGARKMSVEASEAAERMGYNRDLCSYALCDIGVIETGKSPTMGLPKPDFLVVSNSQCGTMTKWFEILGRIHDCPMFLIDVPHSGNGEPDPEAERYVIEQLEELVSFVEERTGNKLDSSRLEESISLSQEASTLWKEILEFGTHVPSPLWVFDQFIAMAPIVAQRGTRVPVEFYQRLKEELLERVRDGIGALERERYRLFWDNLPIWPELRWLSGLLADHGASLVVSLYTMAWTGLAVGHKDPFGDWARQYLYDANLTLEKRVDQYVELARRFRLDGFIYHSNRSCKMLSIEIQEVKRLVSEMTGLPGLIIEADHNDPRLYSRDQIRSQIETFMEMLRSHSR